MLTCRKHNLSKHGKNAHNKVWLINYQINTKLWRIKKLTRSVHVLKVHTFAHTIILKQIPHRKHNSTAAHDIIRILLANATIAIIITKAFGLRYTRTSHKLVNGTMRLYQLTSQSWTFTNKTCLDYNYIMRSELPPNIWQLLSNRNNNLLHRILRVTHCRTELIHIIIWTKCTYQE